MNTRKLRHLTVAAALVAGANVLALGVWAQPAATSAQLQAARPDTDAQRIEDLVIANHILADQGVLDGFGHMSVRSVSNPKHFFMSQSRSAGVVSKDDIMEFDENSQPVDQRGRPMFGERFIHGEIYRARPDAQSVVHSHAKEILPFTVVPTPFHALIHMAAFLGVQPAPVFEIRDAEGPDNTILVSNAKTGAALAKSLGSRSVVLMRGHGMSVVADTRPGGPARWVAFRSYYTQVNGAVLTEALRLGKPAFMNQFEVKRTNDSIDRWWDNFAALAAAHSYVEARK